MYFFVKTLFKAFFLSLIFGGLSLPLSAQWQEIGPISSPISAMGEDPITGTIIIGAYSGLFRSADAGISWGRTWQNEPKELYAGANFAFRPRSIVSQSGNFYAVVSDWNQIEGILAISTDDGMTWTLNDLDDGIGGSYYSSVASIMTTPGRIFLAVNGPDGRRVLRSDNAGTTWQSSALFAHDLIQLVEGVGVVFATHENGDISISVDLGVSYLPYSSGSLPAAPSDMIHTGGNTLYATVPGHGAYRSVGGAAWTQINTGLPVLDLVDIAEYNGRLYIATEVDGVYGSSNDGANWHYAGLAGQKLASLQSVFSFGDHRLFAGGQNGMFRKSQGSSNTWTQHRDGLSTPIIQHLAAYKNNVIAGNEIYDDLQGEDDEEGYLFRAGNPYKNWSNERRQSQVVNRIQQQGDTVFVIWENNDQEGSELFNTELTGGDPGYSFPWIIGGPGADQARTVAAIGNYLFYVSDFNVVDEGYEVSMNKGMTFAHSNNLNETIHTFIAKGSTLYALTDNGLFSSTDMGSNWTLLGFAGMTVESIVTGQRHLFVTVESGANSDFYRFDTQNPGLGWQAGATNLDIGRIVFAKKTLYGNSSMEVLYSQDKGDTWQPLAPGINKSPLQPDAIAHEGNDYLFVGTESRGVWRHLLLSPPISPRIGRSDVSSAEINMTVYPNPANNRLVLEADQAGHVNILSLAGSVLIETEYTEGPQSIHLGRLPAGMYFLQLHTESGVKTSRFVKQ